MKRKMLVWLITVLSVLCLAFGVGCSNESLQLNKTVLSLNLYDEVLLTVDGAKDVEWSSSDENIVKVSEDGLVMAQGVKGEATIKAKTKSGKAECEVSVRDRFIEPALELKDARAFVNGLSEVDVKINYNDVLYTPDTVSLVSDDESIVKIENGKLKGIQEGKTELLVDVSWKKWTASDVVKVAVYGEKVMFLAESEVNIYDVPDTTEAKKNAYTVVPEVFVQGVLQDGTVTLTQTGGDTNSVMITGNTVKVAENYTPDADGETVTFSVATSVTGVPAQTLTINVMPNYIVMNPLEELIETKKTEVEVKAYEGTDSAITQNGAREGIADYTISDAKKNQNVSSKAWAHWNTRLELVSTKTLNGKTAYDSLKEKGYKMVSFDVYYTNVNGADSLHGMFFGMNGCSSYFRTDSQNNRDDMFIVNENGKITNTLKANTWQTVYLDLEKLAVASLTAGKEDCNTFIACNYVNNTAYIDDLRYWFDTTILSSYEDERDMAERTLTQDSANPAKYVAGENEFIAFSPNEYVSFAKVDLNGVDCYKYDNASAKAFEIETKSKINAYNDLNGNAIKQGYQYITFDVFVKSGENLVAPKLSYYDLYKQGTYVLTLQDGAKVQTSCLRLFKGGYEIDTFQTGEWITVALRIDGMAKENFFITARKEFGSAELGDEKSSIFYVKNTNYYKDGSYFNEYSANDLLRAKFDSLDGFYAVGETLNFREVINVYFANKKISDYQMSVHVDGVENTDGVLTFTTTGAFAVEIEVTKTVDEIVHTDTLSFTLKVENADRVVLAQDYIQLYGGSDGYSTAVSDAVIAKAYENKKPVDKARLQYEVSSGGEFISVENDVVTAKENVGEGEASVRVWFEKEDGTKVENTLTVYVRESFWEQDASELMMVRTNDATYEQYNGTVNGRTGVYVYTDTSAGSWEDRLAVYESAHPVGVTNSKIPYVNSVVAYQNMVAKNYNYVTIDVCLTNGAVLRVDSMNARNDYQVGSTLGASHLKKNNPNISICNNDRGVIMKNGDTVVANKWYTIIIDRENTQAPASGDIWSLINFAGSTGTIYFDTVRYYFDDSCYENYAYAQKDGYVEYDGSELVWGGRTSALTAETPYGITTETVGGKTGVYKLDLTGSGGWNDKLMVYECGHLLLSQANGNLETKFPFTSADNAFANMTSKGYHYVAIDVCFTATSLLRCGAPESTGTANKRDDYQAGQAFSKNDNDCIALYKDGVLVTTGTTIETGVWYTLVFDHQSAINGRVAGQWSAMNFSGQGVTYFDKVRYYSANPFATV